MIAGPFSPPAEFATARSPAGNAASASGDSGMVRPASPRAGSARTACPAPRAGRGSPPCIQPARPQAAPRPARHGDASASAPAPLPGRGRASGAIATTYRSAQTARGCQSPIRYGRRASARDRAGATGALGCCRRWLSRRRRRTAGPCPRPTSPAQRWCYRSWAARGSRRGLDGGASLGDRRLGRAHPVIVVDAIVRRQAEGRVPRGQ